MCRLVGRSRRAAMMGDLATLAPVAAPPPLLGRIHRTLVLWMLLLMWMLLWMLLLLLLLTPTRRLVEPERRWRPVWARRWPAARADRPRRREEEARNVGSSTLELVSAGGGDPLQDVARGDAARGLAAVVAAGAPERGGGRWRVLAVAAAAHARGHPAELVLLLLLLLQLLLLQLLLLQLMMAVLPPVTTVAGGALEAVPFARRAEVALAAVGPAARTRSKHKHTRARAHTHTQEEGSRRTRVNRCDERKGRCVTCAAGKAGECCGSSMRLRWSDGVACHGRQQTRSHGDRWDGRSTDTQSRTFHAPCHLRQCRAAPFPSWMKPASRTRRI
jgi:hypothetical protein